MVELFAGLLHAQSDEPEARPRVEDHHENHAVANKLDMNVGLLALVELGGELVLLQELRHAPRGRDVACRQRSEAGGIDVVDVAARCDELPVLVDDEDDLGVRIANQAVDDRLDLSELLLVHHHLGIDHSLPPEALTEKRRTLDAA